MFPPCRKHGEDCRERRSGCQATCAAYLEYRRYMDGRKRERAKDALVKNARYDMARRARKKTTHGEKK